MTESQFGLDKIRLFMKWLLQLKCTADAFRCSAGIEVQSEFKENEEGVI